MAPRAVVAALALASVALASEPPVWPPKILPEWPVRFTSETSGEIQFGPVKYVGVPYHGNWFYDWPTNRWRQNMCVGALGLETCSISFWDGNNQKYYHFSQDLKSCSYTTAPVPAVTHPDSFAQGMCMGRQMVNGRWADSWLVDTHEWIHYNFTMDNDVERNVPLRDCGPLSAKPPYMYACTSHTNVDVAVPFNTSGWEAFFDLPVRDCKPKTGALTEEEEGPDSLVPGALLALRPSREQVVQV